MGGSRKGKPNLDPKTVADVLRRACGICQVAANELNCSRDAVEKQIQKHPEVAAAAREGNEIINDLAEAKLVDAIRRGESWAITFRLKTKAKDRGYVERQELTGTGGRDIISFCPSFGQPASAPFGTTVAPVAPPPAT
jgi:hypothetical protein